VYRCAICHNTYETKADKALTLRPMVCSSYCFRRLLTSPPISESFFRNHLSLTGLGYSHNPQGHLFNRIEWIEKLEYDFYADRLYKPLKVIQANMLPILWNDYKSDYERKFAEWCVEHQINFLYEPLLFDCKYIPDFLISLGQRLTFIEVKGIWEASAYPKAKRFAAFLAEYDIPFYIVNKEFLNMLRRNDEAGRLTTGSSF
jgi:hypothetical protein